MTPEHEALMFDEDEHDESPALTEESLFDSPGAVTASRAFSLTSGNSRHSAPRVHAAMQYTCFPLRHFYCDDCREAFLSTWDTTGSEAIAPHYCGRICREVAPEALHAPVHRAN